MTERSRTQRLERHLKALTRDSDIEIVECYSSRDSTRFKLIGSRDYLIYLRLAYPTWFPVGRKKSSDGYDGFDGRYYLKRQPRNCFLLTRAFWEVGMPENRLVYANEFSVACKVTREALSKVLKLSRNTGR